MRLSQEAKSLLAIMALVGAVAAGLNAVLPAEAQRGDPTWTILLLGLALLLVIWMRRDAMPDDDAATDAEDAAEQAEDLAKRVIIRRGDDAPQDADAD